MAGYSTNKGPKKGPYLYRNAPAAIDVLALPGGRTPIGMARPVGPDGAGLAVWRLTVHGAELPGLWTVIDREFRPVR
jgi:hypothetical protein